MATSDATLAVIEPATEGTLAELQHAGIEETDAAVARAKASFPAWRAVAPGDRAGLLRTVADAIAARAEELTALESRNVGKPIGDARGEVAMVVDAFNYYAGAPERLLGATIPVAGGVDMTFREPLGVVRLIVPWNFPLPIASWKIAPALAAGNTVVLKPAELTPLTALELERLALEAGRPEGAPRIRAQTLSATRTQRRKQSPFRSACARRSTYGRAASSRAARLAKRSGATT